MEKRKRLTCKTDISGTYFFRHDATMLEITNRMGELEDMEEAMQANTGVKDEAFIYIRGENIEDITEALDDIIIRRKSC